MLFRQALVRAARNVVRARPRVAHQHALRPTQLSSLSIRSKSTQILRPLGVRFYSAHAGLGKDEVEGRIMDLLKNFDKVCISSSLMVTILIIVTGSRPNEGWQSPYPTTQTLLILFVKKLNSNTHFANDLGLDSLDTVEVVMAIEEVGLSASASPRRYSYNPRSLASRYPTRKQIRSIVVCLSMRLHEPTSHDYS